MYPSSSTTLRMRRQTQLKATVEYIKEKTTKCTITYTWSTVYSIITCLFDLWRDYFEKISDWSVNIGSWYVMEQSLIFFLFQINGKLTLGENIADNGGFKASHRVSAYKKFIFWNHYSIPSDALIWR